MLRILASAAIVLLSATGVARSQIYADALQILQSQDTAIIPLFYARKDFSLKPRVKSFVHTPIGDVYLRNVSLSP
ncbi:MAG: hypothetical protein HY074_05125 [Deltaproteobacteria bacterium]|nr:hypothetical protein [Deltaproteobacteria bacterium]